MSHYIDIHLKQDPEFPAHQLMAALYAKLHRALVQLKSSELGISFPGYDDSTQLTLGSTLRVLGPPAELDRLMDVGWLHGMRDHVQVRPLAAVPAGASNRHLRRVQSKSSPERLRRRQMRRHGLTEKEALERAPALVAKHLRLPFVQLSSGSTGQVFRLYLQLGPALPQPSAGTFNAYGLSAAATIAWF
jgi:CRISPR-associated endonuclease Csy4